MASVFLSYDHDDSDRAAPIAAALEGHGHSVWWDREIHGGAEYNNEIEAAVAQSDAVVVLWSAASVASPWVRDEAAEGRDNGKLVPVLIDPVKPPMGFRQFQTLDLTGWNGGKRIPHLPALLRAIDKVTGGKPAVAAPVSAPPPQAKVRRPDRSLSRRALVGGGVGTAAVVVAGGAWWFTRDHTDPKVRAAIADARDAIRREALDNHTPRSLEMAVSIEPRNDEALGLLALVTGLLALGADAKSTPGLVIGAQQAAEAALAIKSKEPSALLAMFYLEGSTLDWTTRDQRLRNIIDIDPNSVDAIAELALLTQATGFLRESWEWNERAIKLRPLSVTYLGRRALKLWILGRVPEADKVSDQLRLLFPTNSWAWYVRFLIYAFTGRALAAHEMLRASAEAKTYPSYFRFWEASLAALDKPSASTVSAARSESIAIAQQSGIVAGDAVQVMSALGEVDTGFDIANGLLLSRGSVLPKRRSGSTEGVRDASWRIGTQWVFTPPMAKMRGDKRFIPLCAGVGLTDYWERRGRKPDYQMA